MTLMYAIKQVARNEELFNIARDCFNFVTEFFEPINISATHIYHSALELSPLSSIVRRLYYYRRHTPFPRVLVGSWDSWDQGTAAESAGGGSGFSGYTWSPCGRFVALHTGGEEIVEIRDGLTLMLLSTLTIPEVSFIEPTNSPDGHSPASLPNTPLSTSFIPYYNLFGDPTYSPDGCSLATLSQAFLRPFPPSKPSLTIWDIQTGGVTKQIECNAAITIKHVSLAWSLDGGTICTIFLEKMASQKRTHCQQNQNQTQDQLPLPRYYDPEHWTLHTYDIASGAILFSIMLQSTDHPHLWAHNTSFQIMTTERDGQVITFNIFEVGSVLTKLKSFWFNLPTHWDTPFEITSFSPATYYISVEWGINFSILDICSSKCLLEEEGSPGPDCFSFDGSLIAAGSLQNSYIQIWKYTSGNYTLWRRFSPQHGSSSAYPPPRFSPTLSPTLSSILKSFSGRGILHVWRLDPPLTIIHPSDPIRFAAPHCCATYVVTYCEGNAIITTTNLLSQTPPHFIDTDIEIEWLALTGNVLLVFGSGIIAAWRLTKEGAVDGVFGNKRASFGDNIWTIPQPGDLGFFFENNIGFITEGRVIVHVYHTETGELLDPTQATPPNSRFQNRYSIDRGSHHPSCHQQNGYNSHSEDNWPHMGTAMQQELVKGPEGKHQLWIPAKWKLVTDQCVWLHNIKTLCFIIQRGPAMEVEPVIVKL
jgi:hypothetical protein